MASAYPSARFASTCAGEDCIAPPLLVSHAPSVGSRLNDRTSAGSAMCSSVRSFRTRASPAAVARYLFLLVDDFSLLLVHCRWVTDQNTRAGQEVLRAAIQRRGLPEQLQSTTGRRLLTRHSNAAARCWASV